MEQAYTFSIHIQENENNTEPFDITFPTYDNTTQITNNNMFVHQTININTHESNALFTTVQSSERFKFIMQEMLSMMIRRIDELNISNVSNVTNNENISEEQKTISLKDYRTRINSTREKEKHQTCAICLEELKPGRKWHSPKCGHYFHPKCLQTYLTKKCITPVCPVCRTSI